MKFTLRPKQLSGLFLRLAAAILLSGCGADDPITPARYAGPDALYEQVDKSVKEASELAYYVDIDHSRLAAEHDVVMPPVHVLLASAPALEKALIALDPRLGLELPLRALAFETPDGEARVAFNDWEFIQQRYGLSDASRIGAAYTSAMAAMLAGVPKASLHQFPSNQTSQDSIVTLDSVHDFATTIKRARGNQRAGRYRLVRRNRPARYCGSAPDAIRWPGTGGQGDGHGAFTGPGCVLPETARMARPSGCHPSELQ